MEAELVLAAPSMVSANERRRLSPLVRLALNAADDAVHAAGMPPEELAAVFGSANGDGLTLHHLLESLADAEGAVSPTLFHNSVHNAAIGYWSIGTGSRLPGLSVAVHDYTFGATLLKSVVQVSTEKYPVIMVVFDMPFPEPLHSVRPLTDAFAASLVLTPAETSTSIAKISVDWSAGDPAHAVTEPRTEALRRIWRGNPAGRALPLLELLARKEESGITVRYPNDGVLELQVTRC